MQRLSKRSNPSTSSSSRVEADLGYAIVHENVLKRRSSSRYRANQVICSEAITRRMLWLGTLVILFFMERRRTKIRNSLNLEGTTVLTNIMIEMPEDGYSRSARRLDEFTNLTVGHVIFQDTRACSDLITSSGKCLVHSPFVDLREFLHDHPYKRLKQVMQLPNKESSAAILTQRGLGIYHEDGNQDRAMFISPFYPFSNPGLSSDFLMAVYDGHGQYGHVVAQAAMSALPKALIMELNKASKARNGAVHELITEVFINTFREVDRNVPDIDVVSGTTATVVLKLGQHLHIANVGDARTFVMLYNKEKQTTKLFFGTTPDNLDVPAERERILGMGGSIYLPPPGPRGIQPAPRVYVTTVNNESFALENSRSIGDRAVKATGVICEPKVASLYLPSLWQHHPGEEVFVFSATDGLLDKMAVQGIADRLAGALYRSETVTPLETIEGIILDANQIWEHSRTISDVNELLPYRDDITLTVAKVQKEN